MGERESSRRLTGDLLSSRRLTGERESSRRLGGGEREIRRLTGERESSRRGEADLSRGVGLRATGDADRRGLRLARPFGEADMPTGPLCCELIKLRRNCCRCPAGAFQLGRRRPNSSRSSCGARLVAKEDSGQLF